jgi:hypothetical protein
MSLGVVVPKCSDSGPLLSVGVLPVDPEPQLIAEAITVFRHNNLTCKHLRRPFLKQEVGCFGSPVTGELFTSFIDARLKADRP